MPENTKRENEALRKTKKKDVSFAAEKPETNKKGNWSEDQTEKSYYYDDSYGYEIYDPEDDKDEDD